MEHANKANNAMQANIDDLEEKAMLDAARLAKELRSEQDACQSVM